MNTARLMSLGQAINIKYSLVDTYLAEVKGHALPQEQGQAGGNLLEKKIELDECFTPT